MGKLAVPGFNGMGSGAWDSEGRRVLILLIQPFLLKNFFHHVLISEQLKSIYLASPLAKHNGHFPLFVMEIVPL
jgi:hypothetical protein